MTRFPGGRARGHAVLAAGEFLRSRRLLDPQAVDLVDRLAAVVFQRLDRGMAAIGLRPGGGTFRLGGSEAAGGRFHGSLGGGESLIGPARLLLGRADRLVRPPFVTGDAAKFGPCRGDRLARKLSPPGGLGDFLRACVDRRLEGVDLLLATVDGAGVSRVAFVERSQLAPPRDEPRRRGLHADTELAIHREALAVAGEEERAGRRCLKQRQGVLDPLDDPDSAQQAANEIAIAAGGWFRVAVDEQSVEPPDDAGMRAGIERGRLVQVPGREEADPAPRGEHRLGIIGRRPIRMPGDRLVERVNHEALAKFAQGKVDERGPLDSGDDQVGQHAGESGYHAGAGSGQKRAGGIRHAFLPVDDVLQQRPPLAAGLECRSPAGEIPPGGLQRDCVVALGCLERLHVGHGGMQPNLQGCQMPFACRP